MKYYFGWTSKEALESGTEKAWCCACANGYTSINDELMYIPRSIMLVEDPNEYGNVKVYIPVWFFEKNSIDHRDIRDIDWGENGVSELIEITERRKEYGVER